MAAITAMNDDYVVFEMNGKKKVRKKGVIKISDIQAISEARISEKKAAAFGVVEIFDVDWLPSTDIIAVADENMTVLFKNKEMLVRTGDVLTVIEN